MYRKNTAAVLGCLLLLAALAGCGGNGAASSGSKAGGETKAAVTETAGQSTEAPQSTAAGESTAAVENTAAHESTAAGENAASGESAAEGQSSGGESADLEQELTYTGNDGWSVRYHPAVSRLSEVDAHTVRFDCTGEMQDAGSVVISFTPDKQPEEVLYVLTEKWGDQENIRRREGIFPGTDDKWGCWRIMDGANDDPGLHRTAIAGEYNGGVLCFDITSHMTGADGKDMRTSDILSGILDSAAYEDFGPQTMYSYYPGVYVPESTAKEGAPERIALQDDHTGVLWTDDDTNILWGSKELTATDGSRIWSFTIEGRDLMLELDGTWLTYTKIPSVSDYEGFWISKDNPHVGLTIDPPDGDGVCDVVISTIEDRPFKDVYTMHARCQDEGSLYYEDCVYVIQSSGDKEKKEVQYENGSGLFWLDFDENSLFWTDYTIGNKEERVMTFRKEEEGGQEMTGAAEQGTDLVTAEAEGDAAVREIPVTEIGPVLIGQTENAAAGTGVTVFISKEGMPAGLDVRGGGPASRESQLLNPLMAAQVIHGIVLGGGSAYGLGAANGVMQCLEEHGIGFDVGVTKVPLVAQSDIFDLTVGDPSVRPDAAMGYEAASIALDRPNYRDGNFGAGCGATVGKIGGMETCMKTGIGSYAVQIGELKVGAIVVLNALGDVYDWKTGQQIAGLLDEDKTALQKTTDRMKASTREVENRFTDNTTLAVVITNASFDKAHLCKIAGMAHDGFARSIHPVHTSADGDSIYAVSVGEVQSDMDLVGTLAAETVSEAIIRAVEHSESAYGYPSASALGFTKTAPKTAE